MRHPRHAWRPENGRARTLSSLLREVERLTAENATLKETLDRCRRAAQAAMIAHERIRRERKDAPTGE